MKRVGILGLPQSGKTTVFEILLQGAGMSVPGPSGRDAVGVVRVPDERVDRLSTFYQPKKTTYAQVQFVDSAAAGQGSARAAAKGPDLFSGVRNADAFVAVLRSFENPAVPASAGVDPARDLRALETELILNDLAIVEGRLEKLEKELRIGKKQGEREHVLLGRIHEALESERPLRIESFDADEEKVVRGFQLLSRKPLLAVVNQGDDDARMPTGFEVMDESEEALAASGATGTATETAASHRLAIGLQAHLEREIVALPPAEREAFRQELGVGEDGLSRVIRACYRLLGLISFFTVGPDEVRAWTLTRGETAVDAAGEIHTDLAKGFIRAETIPWDRLLEAGGQAKAREKAWLRLEGRDYVVQDGDCLEIRFNK